MSRIAKNPIHVIKGVDVKIADGVVSVKGPLGALSCKTGPLVTVTLDDGILHVGVVDESREANIMSGTVHALVKDMIIGVTKGFEKKLTLVGVGYRAQAQGSKLNLSLGFSHPVIYELPEGVKAETPSQTEITVKGADKQKVGQVAAEIRDFRPPEPYKGKGVRYVDEVVIIKETKKK